MNLESPSITPFIFTAFRELVLAKQGLMLGPYTEISLKIFKKLGQQDLSNARGVSKEWKQLIEQTKEWKELYSRKIEHNVLNESQNTCDKPSILSASPSQWDPHQIAKSLWHNPTAIIDDSIVAKVNAAADYLGKEGFKLKGVPSDGDCFFSAFLASYGQLARKIPLLDESSDKVFYLRQVLSDMVKYKNNERAEKIKEKRTWINGLGEGDLLATALFIPIRLIIVNEEQLACGIHDRLIFPKASSPIEDNSQEWKIIPEEEKLEEYILIVDLGGHFAYAQKPLKQDKSFLSKSISASNVLFSSSLAMNALKSPVETLESQELLPGEKIKELEQTYTLALQIAVQEKDPIQENFCIEELGDIYLRKQTPETLLQAAGLYNYALRLAPPQRQKILKDKLCQVQNLLVRECKGKAFNFTIMKKHFEHNRNKLKKFREKIEKKIQTLPENPSSQEVRELYHEIAHEIKLFFGQLVIQAIHQLDTEPCEYAMIGFGSLTREEMTPYSDLEFGILIQKDTPVNRKYFRNLTNLLHLQVINLGETILPALNIPCLKAIGFFDDITPRGFAFDGAGVEGKGCKTPLGNGKTFELIQTPGQMAQYVGKDEKGRWWHEKEPHLPMELLNFTHLLGNLDLTKQYEEKVQKRLKISYQGSLDLRQYLARQHLVLADMIAFNPGMGDLSKRGMLFQVKNDFYRFPHLALDRLALLKNVRASDTFTRIDKLNELGVITEDAAGKLKDWMSIALFMRLKTYSHYQAQKETMNPLLKPFSFEDPALIEKQFALDHQALKEIKKIYYIFIPFYQSIHQFLAGNEEQLKSSKLEDKSLETKGHIYQRLFRHEEAKKLYLRAKKEDPQNARVLNALGIIYYEQGDLAKAIEYANKALIFNLKLYGENHPTVARDYHNIGMICLDQGNLDKAAEYSKKALNIDFKLYGKNHFIIANDYNSIGQIYHAQGILTKATEYSNQALVVNLKLYGENHPMVATIYNNLGVIYKEQGNLEQAVDYGHKSLAIDIRLYGENHPKVMRDYSNLGQIYQERGNLDKAGGYTHKALSLSLKLYHENHPDIAKNYNNLGLIYKDQGNLDKATEYSTKALSIDLKLYGENHPAVARDYNNLGAIYKEQSNLDKAIKYSAKALYINLKLHGENHPKIAEHYGNLGVIYHTQGNLDKAIEYSTKALYINLKLHGENHPIVAKDYYNLGLIYQAQGNLDKAIDYSAKALSIDLKLYGENHPKIAEHYSALGIIYQAQGNLSKAAEYSKKALSIDLKLYNENHSSVARDYNNLGQIYREQGNLDKAAEYGAKALSIDLKLYGENHSTIARDYNNLGIIYQDQRNLDKAVEFSTKALIISIKLSGENQPTVAILYSNLGMIYKDQGNLDKATDYANSGLAINLELFGRNHPEVAKDYSNLGEIYHAQGKFDKAIEYSKKALAINLKFFGENHPTLATLYNNLGQIYKDQGKLDKGAEYAAKALVIDLQLFGESHPKVARDYGNLGQIYREQGKLAKATEYANKALAINLKHYGENHSMIAICFSNLGQIYQEQGKLGQATEHFSKALTISRRLLGENHPTVASCYRELGTIYQAQGNLEEAMENLNKALAINCKLFGKNHPIVASGYSNLGMIYQAHGNLDKAAEYSNKALTLDLKLYGENHLAVARDYINLGMIYKGQGSLELAAEYISKFIDINLKLYGRDHPDVIKGYNTLQAIYQSQENLRVAALDMLNERAMLTSCLKKQINQMGLHML
ncbi:hypothetical protein NEOC65_000408 [Neochlamydia sp. AcF65]|uniref:tetratricopeptide repeat protein n=1 Tax=Neochlamydia sp. AcF65 TaxID=2795735 RepID=UPI001BC9F296|nr:tetratricopeptide repeat protein [Neochlamydia sp. AcF65]MBS4165351.1 hypothetical protein [Neochlamydia sp. AcF65]